MRLILLLLLAGCPDPEAEPPPAPDPFCGDDVVDEDEACDDGPDNASEPDACRPDCTLPRCGDGIADLDEGCDDGSPWGGDGCTPACTVEAGQLESEPDDSDELATPLTEAVANGSLPAGDRDCWSVFVDDGGWISAEATDGEGTCTAELQLTLHDGHGALLGSAAPGVDGCTTIDPAAMAAARFLHKGVWTVCASGFLGEPAPAYRLQVEVGDDSCALAAPIDPLQDPDLDGVPNVCDADDDGDSVLDEDDNCPLTPNGPNGGGFIPHDRGYLRHWLVIGAWHGAPTTDACRPSDDEFLGDDAAAAPHLGDSVDGLTWLPWIVDGRRIDFLDRYGGDTPREVYAVTWVHSEEERPATLAMGLDDGARAWLNGEEVADVAGCQGTNVDQFTAEVTLLAGWNRLMLKVRDQGGAWGMIVRFRDDAGPITDLELSLTPDGPWTDDQGDLDGDGLGDVCDPTPAG